MKSKMTRVTRVDSSGESGFCGGRVEVTIMVKSDNDGNDWGVGNVSVFLFYC